MPEKLNIKQLELLVYFTLAPDSKTDHSFTPEDHDNMNTLLSQKMLVESPVVSMLDSHDIVKYHVGERGKVYMDHILNTPIPVNRQIPTWVIENGDT